MIKITLIRHTSVATKPGICYGQSDVEVAETFQAEAELISRKLKHQKFDAVFSSPLKRCFQLAKHLGFEDAITDDRLMELNFGAWEMKKWDEINDPQLARWYENWIDEEPTNGESFRKMNARVNSFLQQIKLGEQKNILIFTHAGVIRSFGILLGKLYIDNAFYFQIQYGDIVEHEIHNKL